MSDDLRSNNDRSLKDPSGIKGGFEGREAKERPGPPFVDGTRETNLKGIPQVLRQAVEHGDGPDYKDQVRSHQPTPRQTETETFDSPRGSEQLIPPSSRPLVEAVLVQERTIVEANQLHQNRRRNIIWSLIGAFVLVCAGVVAGMCFSGSCTSDGSESAGTEQASFPSSAPTASRSRSVEILEYINSVSLAGRRHEYPTSFSSTPEEYAIAWLIEQDNTTDRQRLRQRYALLSLRFQSFDSWINSTGWLEDEDECLWFGIYCTAQENPEMAGQMQMVVSEIVLEYNNLRGPIPSDLALLSRLSRLSFYDNEISGTIPETIGIHLTQLSDLRLSRNQLSGSLPTTFGSLSLLKLFWADDNRLSGMLPDSLGGMVNMEHVSIFSNQFSGPIPDTLSQWTKFQKAELSRNSFSGELPESIGQWRDLKHFDLLENRLTGPLPASLGQWTGLEYIDVSGNALSGPIPTSYDAWTSLTYASFLGEDNLLTGVIPPSICSSPVLMAVQVCSTINCSCCEFFEC